MGQPKADLAFEGRTFLDRVASALLAVTPSVFVVGGPARPPWPTIADEGAPARGPLSGIVTALRHTDSNGLVVAVDHPLVDAGTLKHLAALGDDRPVIPVHDDVPQITCAWYPRTALAPFAAELARGGFVRRALDPMDVRWVAEEEWRSWGEDGSSWHSVDTPEAYGALRAVSLRE
jgi:molybdopterin-guanine dinucleotide biosynthesis protein A